MGKDNKPKNFLNTIPHHWYYITVNTNIFSFADMTSGSHEEGRGKTPGAGKGIGPGAGKGKGRGAGKGLTKSSGRN